MTAFLSEEETIIIKLKDDERQSRLNQLINSFNEKIKIKENGVHAFEFKGWVRTNCRYGFTTPFLDLESKHQIGMLYTFETPERRYLSIAYRNTRNYEHCVVNPQTAYDALIAYIDSVNIIDVDKFAKYSNHNPK